MILDHRPARRAWLFAPLVLLAACGTDPNAPPTDTPEEPPIDPPVAAITAMPATNECATLKPGWIFCDDFEVNRLTKYFEYNQKAGAFVRASGVGTNGSWAMRARFAKGQVNAGYLHLAIGKTPQSYLKPADAGTARYREVYWRLFVKNQTGWIGGGGWKLSRAFIFASSGSWAQAAIGHVVSGGTGHKLAVIDPVSGTDLAGRLRTTTYNDFGRFRYLGRAASTMPVFDGVHLGKWHCVEARMRLNDAGLANGALELWIDGVKQASRTGLNYVGSFSAYGINAVFLENYWNNGAPQAQSRFIDNFVVSRTRIGC